MFNLNVQSEGRRSLILASKHILAAGIWASLAVLPAAAGAETLSGKVVGVADGDTLAVLVDQRTVQVRVAGIDAPEKGQPCLLYTSRCV